MCEVVASAADEGGAASVHEAQGSESIPFRFDDQPSPRGSGPRVASIGSRDRGGEGTEHTTASFWLTPR
jgi:hypothetical protein